MYKTLDRLPLMYRSWIKYQLSDKKGISMEYCNLIKNHLIPKEELDRVFHDSDSASAELDASFLCFDSYYEDVLNHTSPDTVILDLGCAYAPQCWYFKDYERYIGVDLPFGNNVRFQSPNAEFYLMPIQKFIKEVLPALNLDLEHTVAICSMAPDKEALELVRDTFPRHYVVYPSLIEKSVVGIYESGTRNQDFDIEQDETELEI